MTISKFIKWAGLKSLGPVGDVISGTSALLEEDEPDLVEETGTKLDKMATDKAIKDRVNCLNNIDDYEEKCREATRGINRSAEATQDHLAAMEVKYLRMNDRDAVENIREERKKDILDAEKRLNEVRTNF